MNSKRCIFKWRVIQGIQTIEVRPDWRTGTLRELRKWLYAWMYIYSSIFVSLTRALAWFYGLLVLLFSYIIIIFYNIRESDRFLHRGWAGNSNQASIYLKKRKKKHISIQGNHFSYTTGINTLPVCYREQTTTPRTPCPHSLQIDCGFVGRKHV